MRTKNLRINSQLINGFKRKVWKYYRAQGRHGMVWRKTKDPYKILVSEIMLQQTQVARAEKFYPKFIGVFPDFHTLARAPLKSVLRAWQGMGYNRRAIALKRLAQEVVEKRGGKLPNNVEALLQLPGIGNATAGALMAYAFNLPVPFIETNIRRVFIFHFFTTRHPDRRDAVRPEAEGSLHSPSAHTARSGSVGMTERRKVDDKDILKLVEQTIDRKNPREWCWALMDYGTMLAAREKENPNVRSARYRKQPKFEGSRRQMRGRILRLLLLRKGGIARAELNEFNAVLPDLLREGFIKEAGGRYRLA